VKQMDRTKKSMRTEAGGKYHTLDGVGGVMGVCTLLKGGHSIVSSREVCWRQPVSFLGLDLETIIAMAVSSPTV
jgi:hypothetical protein